MLKYIEQYVNTFCLFLGVCYPQDEKCPSGRNTKLCGSVEGVPEVLFVVMVDSKQTVVFA